MHSPRTSVADRPWKGFELGLRVAVAPSNLIFEVQRGIYYSNMVNSKGLGSEFSLGLSHAYKFLLLIC